MGRRIKTAFIIVVYIGISAFLILTFFVCKSYISDKKEKIELVPNNTIIVDSNPKIETIEETLSKMLEEVDEEYKPSTPSKNEKVTVTRILVEGDALDGKIKEFIKHVDGTVTEIIRRDGTETESY